MPIEIGAGEPGHFQRKDGAHLSHRDVCHERLEVLPPRHLGSRFAQVSVEDPNRAVAPAQAERLLAQRILPLGALLMVAHLARCRLTQIDVGGFAAVVVGDLRVHRPPPAGPPEDRGQASLRAYWRAVDRPRPRRSGWGPWTVPGS